MNLASFSINRRQMTGAGMVEVLVALIVIGVGMLGIASLYVVTLQAKTTSQSRMQAVNLATDMAERIRANPTALTNYSLASTNPAPTATANCFQTASSAAVSCSDIQLAASDLAQWSTLVNNTLPGSPFGKVTYTPGTPAKYQIELDWTEPSAGSLQYLMEIQI